jgi:endonuclease YncB( thermonuclease family)
VITNVVDGDTIDVEIRKVVRVRLLDCWCDELRSGSNAQKFRGAQAKKYMERLASGTTGVLFVPTTGANKVGDVTTMGRVLGHYWVDGQKKSLSEIMVESGYASTTKPKEAE